MSAMSMDESADAVRRHIQQIVTNCRKLPRDRQRSGVNASSRELLSAGMQTATVFAIERQCLECLFLDPSPTMRSPETVRTYVDGIEKGCRSLARPHWPAYIAATLVGLEKAGIDRGTLDAVDEEIERRLELRMEP